MSRHLKSNLAACWRRFEAKLSSKIAPSWLQERLGSGATSIFKGLEVELLFETLLSCDQDEVGRIETLKLALWEEGREEGEPSPHKVYSSY